MIKIERLAIVDKQPVYYFRYSTLDRILHEL